ncbi:MAG: hypothetical protein DMG94_01150, partial [Acidobacteria bacterium]
PERLTKLDPSKHTTHRWPSFLPDGKHFLFFATNHSGTNPEQNGIYLGSVDSSDMKLVLASDSAAQYASGYLLYHLQTALIAQKIDPATATLSGDPIAITDHAQYDPSVWRTTFSASDEGTLITVSGESAANTDLIWVDRAGKDVGYAVKDRLSVGVLAGLRLSPDGKRVAITADQPRADIFVFDLARGTKTRITFNPAQNMEPSWSPDGQKIVFSELSGSRLSAGSTLHAHPSNGGGQDELLAASENDTTPVTFTWPQWSPDGKYLLYGKANGPTGASVWAVQTSGEKKPFLVVQPQGQQGTIDVFRVSPNGKWLAYTSNESGRQEIYITSFPQANGRWQISQSGGTAPVWRGDSRELYFYEFSGGQSQIDAVEVVANGDQLETRNYRKLFSVAHILAGGNSNFDVTPAGNRFLIPVQPEVTAAPISLTLNWPGKLGK